MSAGEIAKKQKSIEQKRLAVDKLTKDMAGQHYMKKPEEKRLLDKKKLEDMKIEVRGVLTLSCRLMGVCEAISARAGLGCCDYTHRRCTRGGRSDIRFVVCFQVLLTGTDGKESS